jgi:hypothetical protein
MGLCPLEGDEEMVRSVASKVVWVGRATLFLVGLAVVLAVVLGLAGAALAGTGAGDVFNLGRNNTVNRISQLAGSTDNPMLRITNDNAGTDATALTLQVEPGLTPMKVNSSTQVSNLNADLVDGRSASSFVANSTYRLGQGEERAGTPLSDGSKVLSRSCLAGDRLLSGGPASVNVNSDVLDSFAQDTNTWQARINDSAVSGGDSFTVVVLCADQ